jgi:hypothetical protein
LWKHETNQDNPFQGEFRTGRLDLDLLKYALNVDMSYLKRLELRTQLQRTTLHITCCDHVEKHELAGPITYFLDSTAVGDIFCHKAPYRDQSRLTDAEKLVNLAAK